MGFLGDFQIGLEKESDDLFGDVWRKGSRLYWATSLAGEVGEVCNLVKKEARDDVDLSPRIGEELADVLISTFLMASALGFDLDGFVARKREEIRTRAADTSRMRSTPCGKDHPQAEEQDPQAGRR